MIGGAIEIGQGDLFQEVAMPEAMGVMPLIRPPAGWVGRWRQLLTEGALQMRDGRGADLQLLRILQIPGEPLRAKIGFGFDRVAELLLGVWRQALGRSPRGRPFGDTREGQALPYPLNRPRTGCLRAVALLDLRRTPGGMALTQGSN